jgi:hypothetical protein
VENPKAQIKSAPNFAKPMKAISLQQRQNKSVLHAWRKQLITARGRAVISAFFLVAGMANGQQRPPELEAVTWNLGANVAASGVNGVVSKTFSGNVTLWDAGAVSSKSILRDGAVVFSAASGSQLEVGL